MTLQIGDKMNKNKEKVPKIRFPGFTEPWEQRKLGDVFAQKVNYVDPIKEMIELWSLTVEKGLTPKTERYNREALVKKNDKFKVVHPGDIVYNPMNMTIGAVGFNNSSKIVAVSGYYVTMNMKTGFDNKFFNTWLPSPNALNLYKNYATGSLIEKQRVQFPTLSGIKLDIPKLEEQIKIGSFFAKIDNLITLHQRKLNHLKDKKKGLLQKMFPKKGELVPELRFPEFTDPWEQRKLGELSNSFEYGLNAAATEFDGKNKYIRITDINDESRDFMDDDLTSPDIDLSNADKYKLSRGDILFARTGASVGKTYIYKECDGLVYYAGFLIRAKIREEYNPGFIFQNTLTKDYEKYISITSQRSGQPGVNAQEYSEYKIMVPNRAEQDKISAYFRSIDNLITLHQRKLDHLKEQKKALLQQMFI